MKDSLRKPWRMRCNPVEEKEKRREGLIVAVDIVVVPAEGKRGRRSGRELVSRRNPPRAFRSILDNVETHRSSVIPVQQR